MKYFFISFIGTILLGLLLIGFSYQKENVVIKINNPYGFDIKAELKCDWNDKTKRFDLQENYFFPAYRKTKIILPKQYLQCEIWPKLKVF